MNVTESRFKNRQLHIEDYLQMVSAEQKEYAEAFDYSRITEKRGVVTKHQRRQSHIFDTQISQCRSNRKWNV